MSQTYATIAAGDTLQTSRTTINNNLDALLTHFSGTAFPSSPSPVAGQACFRTDAGAANGANSLYIYDGASWRFIAKVTAGGGLFQLVGTIETGIPGAGATTDFNLFTSEFGLTIVQASVIFDQAQGTSGTDYYRFTLRNRTDATDLTTSIGTDSVAVTANARYALGAVTSSPTTVAVNKVIGFRSVATGAPVGLVAARARITVLAYAT